MNTANKALCRFEKDPASDAWNAVLEDQGTMVIFACTSKYNASQLTRYVNGCAWVQVERAGDTDK